MVKLEDKDYKKLIVTKYGIIRGEDSAFFYSTKIEKFLKRLGELIDAVEINSYSKGEMSFEHLMSVYKVSDNVYRINRNNDDYIDFFGMSAHDNDFEDYRPILGYELTLNPKDALCQSLKNKLDALCEKTKKNDYCEEIVNAREQNSSDEKYNDKESLQIHLEFLKGLKEYRRKFLDESILKSLCGAVFSLCVCSVIPNAHIIHCVLLSIVTSLFAAPIFEMFFGGFSSSLHLFLKYLNILWSASINKEKIKDIEYELSKMQSLNATKTKVLEVSKEKEESNVPRINYGNKYKNATINRISYLFGVISDLPFDLYREAGLKLMGYLQEALAIIQADEQKNPEVRNADWWQDYIIVSVEVKLDLFENRINELLHPTGQQLTIVEGEELLKKMQAVFGEEPPSSQTPPAYMRKLVPEQNGQVAGGH